MRPLLFLLSCGLLFSVTWSSHHNNDKRTLGLIAKAVNNFTTPLLSASRHVHGHGTNLLISPFSISVAMAMLLEGSAGNTQKQIVEALQFQNTASELQTVRNGFRTLLSSILQETGDYILDAENAVFVQENVGLHTEFQNALAQYYMAVAESKDFQGNTAGVEQEINDLVRRSTRNEIPQFLSPGSLSPDTIVYLLSAVYFSGNWESQFPKSNTKLDTFHLNELNTVEVPMMNVEASFRADYIEKLNSDAIELPYKGSRLSMLLIVPRDKSGLQAIEGELTGDLLEDIIYKQITHRPVTLSMPKMKMEADLKLREVMMEMGVTDVFNQQAANLSKISPAYDSGLYVNSAKHKVTLNVDEEGSKVAAVTGFGIVPLAGFWRPPPPMTITANRPFMLYIYDWATRMILFVGVLNDPSTSSQSIVPLLGKQPGIENTEGKEGEEEEGQWSFEPSFPVFYEKEDITDSSDGHRPFNPFSAIFDEEVEDETEEELHDPNEEQVEDGTEELQDQNEEEVENETEDELQDQNEEEIEDQIEDEDEESKEEEIHEDEEDQLWVSEPQLPGQDHDNEDSFDLAEEGRRPFNPFSVDSKLGPTGRKASPLIEMLREDLESASSDRIFFKGPFYHEYLGIKYK